MNRYRHIAGSARWVMLTLLSLSLNATFARPGLAEELRLDARALFERSVSRDVRLSTDRAAIELDQGELFEDDGPAAGYSYQPNEERLSAGTWIKKELLIPNPQARKATLLVGPGGDLQAIINGKRQDLRREGKAGGYWEAYSFPPEALKPGKNEIVLHGSARVWIARDDEFAAGSPTRTRHPNRSARSTDGGKTWDYNRLGTNGNIDGEYYVRVFLDHYRPQGSLTLPVVDLGNEGATGWPLPRPLAEPHSPGMRPTRATVAAPVASLGPVRITIQGEAGQAGRITIRVRSGTTYVPQEKHWSAWQTLAETGGTLEKPAGRYLQVGVELVTADPLTTPKLKQVIIEATPKRSSEWTKNLRVVESHNEEIVGTAIPFAYERFDHPHLRTLRHQYKLDEVVKGAKGEFDLITRLAAWSSQQWSKGHLREAYPAWDALEILKPHRDGNLVGGFCQQYNLVFLQACESFGLVGRAVSIGPGDHGARIRGGHEVVEIWSNEHKKWVYVDGNTAWYAVDDRSNIPLSLWELRERQVRTLKAESAPPIRIVKIAESRHSWEGLEGWPPFLELRLIPRSNFLEEKSPLPLNQGMRGWFWTGHHVWTDERAPASLLYGNRVSNRRNWEWTLNQAHYVLEATDTPGELRVHVDTETPGFETFLANIDGRGERPVASGFVWKLHKGKNRLEVRPRNAAGRAGIVSWVVIDYQ